MKEWVDTITETTKEYIAINHIYVKVLRLVSGETSKTCWFKFIVTFRATACGGVLDCIIWVFLLFCPLIGYEPIWDEQIRNLILLDKIYILCISQSVTNCNNIISWLGYHDDIVLWGLQWFPPLLNLNLCTKSFGYSPKNYWDISDWTKMVNHLTDIAFHEATLIAWLHKRLWFGLNQLPNQNTKGWLHRTC